MSNSSRFSLLILFLFALSVLVSCDGASSTEPEGDENLIPTTLNGTVRNMVSAKGLEGVVMTLGNDEYRATSTAQGAYSFDSLAAGVYKLTAELNGFRTEHQEVNVRENRTNRADFLLAPASPRLTVTPDTLNFGAETDTLTISISQINNDFTNYRLSANTGWISFDHTSGSIQGGDIVQVAVTVDRSQLETGTYFAIISINTDIGNAGVTVAVEKREPALQDAAEWQQVGTGVQYGVATYSGGNDVFIGIGGWSVKPEWASVWLTELWKAKLAELGVAHIYSVKGPDDVDFQSREIENGKLAEHLVWLAGIAAQNGNPVERIIVAAHSSGAYVAHDLFHKLYTDGIDAQGLTDGKITYFSLDGDAGGSGSTALTEAVADRLAMIYAVAASDGNTRTYSANKPAMEELAGMFGAKSQLYILNFYGTGCNAGASWCLHDTMINQKPHDPDYFSLKRDYTEFSDAHPVTWQYLKVFE